MCRICILYIGTKLLVYGGAYCKSLVVKPISQYGSRIANYVATQLYMDPRKQY